jgi:microcystin-dependent protein
VASSGERDQFIPVNLEVPMDPLVGEIRLLPYNFTPNNWAPCDGTLLQINQHVALFSLIGTAFGGDGKTTFALPDLRKHLPWQPNQGQGTYCIAVNGVYPQRN